MARVKPGKVKVASTDPVGYWFLEICGDVPVKQITRTLGVKPTHYFTPRTVSPPSFRLVKDMSLGDKYGWCWRTGLLTPDEFHTGGDMILELLDERVPELRALRLGGASVNLGVSILMSGGYSSQVDFSRRLIRFMRSVGGLMYVMCWNDHPIDFDRY